jgi:hypothetical protein
MIDRAHGRGREDRRPEGGQPVGQRPLEHVIADLVARAEPGAVDGAQGGEVALGGGLLGGQIVVGDEIAELVGIAQVAAEQREERIALEEILVRAREQRLERLRLGRLGGRGGRRRRRSSARGRALR